MGVVPAQPSGRVWHVGHRPDPWAWVPERFAGNQRWDDSEGLFRTVYAADTRYGCYLEVLAQFRRDPEADVVSNIVLDPDDVAMQTYPAGEIDLDWIGKRIAASARMDGVFCDVTAAESIAALRPQFLRLAGELGLPDFDAAALKSAHPRTLTQSVATHLYALSNPVDQTPFAGVRFASRHGDEVALWALFERDGDRPHSRLLTDIEHMGISPIDPDLRAAMRVHDLTWPGQSTA